ncbi:Aec78 [Escherichia coli]|nr:Aec78 [Escherichia coli]
MKSLTTETALDILIAWLQDNIDCESGIIFDNNEDKRIQQHCCPVSNRPERISVPCANCSFSTRTGESHSSSHSPDFIPLTPA